MMLTKERVWSALVENGTKVPARRYYDGQKLVAILIDPQGDGSSFLIDWWTGREYIRDSRTLDTIFDAETIMSVEGALHR